MSEEERLQRQRELNRQRQQRYAERQRAEKEASEQETLALASGALAENANGGPNARGGDSNAHFQFKNPFQQNGPQPEVKLLTIKEADEARDKLVYLFIHGSSLLDDLLEIIVKDHEAVQIWRMDSDEAGLFADAQLERSKKDKEAARVTRIMLRVYDRMMWIIYAAPRLKASTNHIQEHGGLSFR